MVATRSATSSVLICSSGVPCLTAAAAMTSSWVTAPRPVMTTLRADMIGVKYSSRPSPTNNATSATVHTTTFRPRTAPRAGVLDSSADLPCARRLASRRACSIAMARACAARRASRSRRARRRGPSNSSAASASGSGSASSRARRASLRARPSPRRRARPSPRCRPRARSPHARFGSARRRGRGWPAPASAVTISGPSIVTSPAPIVTTTSPGCAASATSSATAEKSGT